MFGYSAVTGAIKMNVQIASKVLVVLFVGRDAWSQTPDHRPPPDLAGALETVSARFNIPVGLEYRISRVTTQIIRVSLSGVTADEELTTLVKQIPGYQWRFEGGVVHVFEQSIVRDKRNPLNLMLDADFSQPSSTAATSSLLMQAAEEIVLRRPGRGIGGSFPQGIGELQVTLKTRHAPLRQFLNELVRVGRAHMWVVTFPEALTLTGGGFFEVAPAVERRNTVPGLPPLWKLLRWTPASSR